MRICSNYCILKHGSCRHMLPKCRWEPDGKPHWKCSCGTTWDTFSTGASCPGCGKVWGYTQCVSPDKGGCHSRSPHLDWYHGLNDIVERLKEEIKEGWLVEVTY